MSIYCAVVNPGRILWQESPTMEEVTLRLGEWPSEVVIILRPPALEKFLEATHIFALSRQPAE